MDNKKDDKVLLLLKDLISSVIISLVIVVIITQFLFKPVKVDGLSMYPTLNHAEVGISNIIGLKMNDVKRQDVVVVHFQDKNRFIVKRVIGLPGETIEAKNGVIYINEVALDEPYLDTDFVSKWEKDNDDIFTSDFGPLTVPEDSYFVLGDNRRSSSDSRVYGSFHKNTIKSKGVFVIFPLQKLRNIGG